jgi:hypothetical protein
MGSCAPQSFAPSTAAQAAPVSVAPVLTLQARVLGGQAVLLRRAERLPPLLQARKMRVSRTQRRGYNINCSMGAPAQLGVAVALVGQAVCIRRLARCMLRRRRLARSASPAGRLPFRGACARLARLRYAPRQKRRHTTTHGIARHRNAHAPVRCPRARRARPRARTLPASAARPRPARKRIAERIARQSDTHRKLASNDVPRQAATCSAAWRAADAPCARPRARRRRTQPQASRRPRRSSAAPLPRRAPRAPSRSAAGAPHRPTP